MSDQPTFSAVVDLKKRIAAETDPSALVALYEQLVPMLREPRKRRVDMTFTERQADNARRRAAREAGINLRTGLPWTAEELAKKAETAAKLKGRKMSPESKAKLAKANEARHNRQAAMEARLAELEAMVAGKPVNGSPAEEPQKQQGRRR